MWIIIITLALIYILHKSIRLYQYRALARSLGLPYYTFPVSETNIFYLALFETRLVPYLISTWLPRNLADYLYASSFKYCWTVKDRLLRRYGGVYAVASPAGIFWQVSDAEVAGQVCRNRRGFPKPTERYEGLAIYGSNVLTCNDSEWPRHRRYTQAAFKEKSNELVWRETIRQTTEMLECWTEQYARPDTPSATFTVSNLREHILKATLNVFCGAGFGVPLPFKPSSHSISTEEAVQTEQSQFKDAPAPPPGYHFTFRHVLEYMNRHLSAIFIAVGILPKWLSKLLASYFRTELNAYHDLGNYLRSLISLAKHDDEGHAHDLLAGLVRSQQDERLKNDPDSDTPRRNVGLTDEEVLGNMYIFTLAGHETTATTLRYALVQLALDQDLQEELYREIQEVTRAEPADWDYDRVFPRLVLPLCIMLETLRLYPPAVIIPKSTGASSTPITHHNRTYILPPNTGVNLNVHALHYAPEYWGPDAAHFNPRRWDKRNATSYLARNDHVEGLAAPGLEFEDVIHRPVRGAFLGFSDGFRACVGRKFAQVEVVGFLAVVFDRFRVWLVGSEEEAQRVLQESSAFVTLAMRDDIQLLFERR